MKRFDATEKKLNNNVDFPFTFSFSPDNLNEELRRKEQSGYIVDYYDRNMEYFTAHKKQVIENLTNTTCMKQQSMIRRIQPPKKHHTYELYAMIIHVGLRTRVGHYYTLIRHKDGWLKFDDEKITLIASPEKFFADSQKAYILFYQKKWVYEKDAPKSNPPPNDDVQISVDLTPMRQSKDKPKTTKR
jgi:hypothetical protein